MTTITLPPELLMPLLVLGDCPMNVAKTTFHDRLYIYIHDSCATGQKFKYVRVTVLGNLLSFDLMMTIRSTWNKFWGSSQRRQIRRLFLHQYFLPMATLSYVLQLTVKDRIGTTAIQEDIMFWFKILIHVTFCVRISLTYLYLQLKISGKVSFLFDLVDILFI